MNMHIESYLQDLIARLRTVFQDRLLYVGLQGSHFRKEADENSDVDIVLILDELSLADLDQYDTILSTAPDREKICGFVCGRAEMENWNPLEICHLLHTTGDYYGRLCDLLPAYTLDDVRLSIRLGLDNLYHQLVHTYLHQGVPACTEALPALYKPVFFLLQNIHFLQTGRFIRTQRELLSLLPAPDQQVLGRCIALRRQEGSGTPADIQLLLQWLKDTKKNLFLQT